MDNPIISGIISNKCKTPVASSRFEKLSVLALEHKHGNFENSK